MQDSKHQKQCCLFDESKVRFPKSVKKPSRDNMRFASPVGLSAALVKANEHTC